MAILLAITVFLPVLGGVALAFLPRADGGTARRVAMGVALATLVLSLILLAAFRANVEGPQFSGGDPTAGRYGISWTGDSPVVPDRPDIRLAFGLDGLSLWLFVLTSLLMITAICCSWESITDRVAAHYGFLLALETG